MARFELPVACEPRPFELGRAVADRPGAVLFGVPGKVYVASDPVAVARSLDPEPELRLSRAAGELEPLPRWFGLLPYESRRDLERGTGDDARPAPQLSRPLWLRYAAVAEVTDRVRVVGDDEGAVRELAGRLGGKGPRLDVPRVTLAEPIEAPQIHARRVRWALEHIARGDVYQVNLARRFRFDVSGSPFALLAELAGSEPPPFPFALRGPELDVVGLSPELFVDLDANRGLLTEPIKGTRPRAFDEQRDAELVAELAGSEKERAELTMILDVERNDLGRLARTGTVRVSRPPHVVTFGTVHHRLATVAAELRPELGRAHVLEAMLPSGSVTGAPKVRAMELIAELEAHRRGLYTGAYGMVRSDGSMTLAMAIRTLTVVQGQGHYFAGGGIVADSVPELEVEETLWKAARILHLAGAGAGNWA